MLYYDIFIHTYIYIYIYRGFGSKSTLDLVGQVCYNLSTSTNATPYASDPFKALGELLAKPPGDAQHLRDSLTVWQVAEQPEKIMSLADGELSSARFEADGLRSIFREVSGEFGTFLSMLSLNV